ncbi:unnamed protein product [Oikopleura dioica]|uniref:Uncharacterized protein n=1 Tax=Oikopleura dioica TaxID=34765 RepID=E4X7C7_OIKDI|nr:unnamed protein product [Oikopleura dioica]CBY40589.1 unnamed protein product [Oikopleura dioica]
MPLENLLAKATFSRSKETVQYQRIDEARSLLNEGSSDAGRAMTQQLKSDGYRLDELSDDSDIDLIMPPLPREQRSSLQDLFCCCFRDSRS